MLRSRPPQPPVTETDLDTPELQQGWQVLMRWGTLGILLSCAMAWFWSTGDTWDRLIDPPIYGVLAALLLTVLANRRGRISLSALITWLPVSASLWLLTKLGLLLGLGSPLNVLLREMNESLVWVPPLLAWNMLTGAERQGGLIPSQIILALLTVICLVGGTYWFRTVGWAPEAGGGLGQLWLASLVTYAGMYYFTQRMQKLQAIQGERRALARMAYHDLLTGLPNRLSLEQELQERTAPGSEEFTLLFIDLDSFKVVNDTMGHALGDQLLQMVAQTLPPAGAPVGQAFRLSGDEFVVLLPRTSSEQARQLAQQLQRNIAERSARQLSVSVSLSIGISCFPDDGLSPQELLRHADSAMYAVKREGRGQVRPYHAEQDQQTERFQHVARAIGQSSQPVEDGFRLVYQPIYDLRTGRIVKAETLLRWDHGELGALSPAEFIPVAERIGQMPRLGSWVLEQACQEARSWDGVKVSVNVSAHQLTRSDFAAQVAGVLQASGLSSQQLELELTETAQLYGDERVERNLEELDRLGIGLSIDDFGAGYANLSRLRSLQISGIKLDRSLIDPLPAGDDFCHLITEAMAALSYRYSLDLTAEGLETQEHIDLVYEMGCPLGQGFALSPPLPPDALRDLLRQPAHPTVSASAEVTAQRPSGDKWVDTLRS